MKRLKFIFLYLLIFSQNFTFFQYAKGEDLTVVSAQIKRVSTLNNSSSFYILGPGDVLNITFDGFDDFDSLNTLIGPEGIVNLPELGFISIEGYTLMELESLLTTKYRKYVKNPSIYLEIVQYRPITFYIAGEVKRPGLYSFNKYSPSANSNTMASGAYPRVFDAIAKSKGITSYANLSEIKVIRKNSKTNGGGFIQTSINLAKLILEGDQSQNIRLYDGDTIEVAKSEIILKDQIYKAYKTNLNPETFGVFVTGNVGNSGLIPVKQGTSLVQAIALAGGLDILSGPIEFIRFNDDGTTSRSYFKYDRKAKSNTKKNPLLQDGDIVYVRDSILGTTTKVVSKVTSPFVGIYGSYKVFEEIFGD
tara:strand:- start:1155 stop:2243 length:1089 start_codon:yes stop_codon:yes gene_type:complete